MRPESQNFSDRGAALKCRRHSAHTRGHGPRTRLRPSLPPFPHRWAVKTTAFSPFFAPVLAVLSRARRLRARRTRVTRGRGCPAFPMAAHPLPRFSRRRKSFPPRSQGPVFSTLPGRGGSPRVRSRQPHPRQSVRPVSRLDLHHAFVLAAAAVQDQPLRPGLLRQLQHLPPPAHRTQHPGPALGHSARHFPFRCSVHTLPSRSRSRARRPRARLCLPLSTA